MRNCITPNLIVDATDPCNDGQTPEGLGTALQPARGCALDDHSQVSKDVKAYLYEVQCVLMNHLDQMEEKDTQKLNKTTQPINSLLSKLRAKKDLVEVPTDKTNSVRLMKTVQYMNAVTQHLAKDAVKCDSAKLDTIHKEALKMLATPSKIFSPKMNLTTSKVQSTNVRCPPCAS